MIQTMSELGPAAAAVATHCRLLHAVTKYKTTSPSPSDRLRWTSAGLPLIPHSHCALPTPHLSQVGSGPPPRRAARARSAPGSAGAGQLSILRKLVREPQ